MQAQVMIGQAMEQYAMLDYANGVLKQCWSICYDKNLSREELVSADTPDKKLHKMDACARKCVSREFEVMKLMNEARERMEREAAQQMAG